MLASDIFLHSVPAVRYLVSVKGRSSEQCGPPVSVECYTEEGQPPVVTGVEVERINGTAMNVSWTPLNKAQAGGFIQSYIITYTVSSEGRTRRQGTIVVVSAHKSSEVIGGLDPASQYNVTVAARSGGGTSTMYVPSSDSINKSTIDFFLPDPQPPI